MAWEPISPTQRHKRAGDLGKPDSPLARLIQFRGQHAVFDGARNPRHVEPDPKRPQKGGGLPTLVQQNEEKKQPKPEYPKLKGPLATEKQILDLQYYFEDLLPKHHRTKQHIAAISEHLLNCSITALGVKRFKYLCKHKANYLRVNLNFTEDEKVEINGRTILIPSKTTGQCLKHQADALAKWMIYDNCRVIDAIVEGVEYKGRPRFEDYGLSKKGTRRAHANEITDLQDSLSPTLSPDQTQIDALYILFDIADQDLLIHEIETLNVYLNSEGHFENLQQLMYFPTIANDGRCKYTMVERRMAQAEILIRYVRNGTDAAFEYWESLLPNKADRIRPSVPPSLRTIDSTAASNPINLEDEEKEEEEEKKSEEPMPATKLRAQQAKAEAEAAERKRVERARIERQRLEHRIAEKKVKAAKQEAAKRAASKNPPRKIEIKAPPRKPEPEWLGTAPVLTSPHAGSLEVYALKVALANVMSVQEAHYLMRIGGAKLEVDDGLIREWQLREATRMLHDMNPDWLAPKNALVLAKFLKGRKTAVESWLDFKEEVALRLDSTSHPPRPGQYVAFKLERLQECMKISDEFGEFYNFPLFTQR